ncbi:hypothetical protein GCM10022259_02330 [Aquimarina mytili]
MDSPSYRYYFMTKYKTRGNYFILLFYIRIGICTFKPKLTQIHAKYKYLRSRTQRSIYKRAY